MYVCVYGCRYVCSTLSNGLNSSPSCENDLRQYCNISLPDEHVYRGNKLDTLTKLF